MNFSSIIFIVFFLITVILFNIVPKKIRAIWLLIASYFFYAFYDVKSIAVIVSITALSYIFAKLITKFQNKIPAKIFLWAGILVNILLFVFFRYNEYFLSLFNSYFPNITNVQSLIVPLGISFITFKAISYLVDVYRCKIYPSNNIIDFALYIAFFPEIVCGPIDRASNLLTQIENIKKVKRFDYSNFELGITSFVYGFFMKMVCVNRLAMLVDFVYGKYFMFGTVELLTAVIFYSLQIYLDFYSYTLIAKGAAKIMGIDICENFDTPYFAKSIKEFWRGWHISLSTWFRDYLYIPLGGNRVGIVRKYLNLIITFLVSGIWHGTTITFVMWGLIHGILQVIGDVTNKIRNKIYDLLKVNKNCFSFKIGQCFITFMFVSISWIFFRAESIEVALQYIKRLFTLPNFWTIFDGTLYELGLDIYNMNVLVIVLGIIILMDVISYLKKDKIENLFVKQNYIFKIVVLTLFILSIIFIGIYGDEFNASNFIYSNF